jgi:hypothetical protein
MNEVISIDKIKARCDMLLGSMLASNDDLASRWWHSPNRRWDGKHPQSVFDEDPWEVYEYLLQHADSGGW